MKISDMEHFSLSNINAVKYLFFTGKGGVGKTSTACAVAAGLSDMGKKVLLVSTDPASNLHDVFERELDGTGTEINEIPGLYVANLDPEKAAADYRESVVGPYRGIMPDAVITSMEEQLSGSCTVEIAAFDQFTNFLADKSIEEKYDHVVFDTAPTGHTLRMLQLPSAWTSFISESTHGASCLGQLSGLEDKKEVYRNAMNNLADGSKTLIILVTRPEDAPLDEAYRTSGELRGLHIDNQMLIVNGVLESPNDPLSSKVSELQESAVAKMADGLSELAVYKIPLRSYSILGVEKIRAFFSKDEAAPGKISRADADYKSLSDLVDDMCVSGKKIIFTMGKGGVGKTTVAAAIAKMIADKDIKVHLTSTDPANHLNYVIDSHKNISTSSIDEKEELRRYSEEVLSKARESMTDEDLAYIEEDLRSPCTQEIAVFRAFAEIVEKSTDSVVVIDTAPTGHTLLLLDATESYHKEVERTKGEVPPSVANLLPRLRDASQTEVVIVTLPDATPVHEAERLKEDLDRAGIINNWWIVNQCFSLADTSNPVLVSRSISEKAWIDRVSEISKGSFAVIPWIENVSADKLG
jgi:arsenite/tail-anchored protein-transporting ATPase